MSRARRFAGLDVGVIRWLAARLPQQYRRSLSASIVELYCATRPREPLRRVAHFAREGASLLRLLAQERSRLGIRERAARQGEWGPDLRYAWRALWRARRYAIAVVVTLALGNAGVTVLANVVRVTLLTPLPYADAGALVRIVETPRGPYSGQTTSLPNVLAWQERLRLFEQVVAVGTGAGVNVRSGETATRAVAASFSDGTFEMLGVAPLLGATLKRDDYVAGAPRRVVLMHAFWMRALGGDSSVVRGSIVIDGTDVEVAGVMPAGFTFPGNGVDLVQPLRFVPGAGLASPNGRWARLFQAYGRLRSGVAVESAEAELEAISRQLQVEFGPPNEGMTAQPVPLRAAMLGDTRRLVTVLGMAAVLVLCIACANIVALTRVRVAARSHEFAVRAVHGAARGTLARLLAAELALLSLLGGLAGAALALFAGPQAVGLIPSALPHGDLSQVTLVATAVVVGVITGLAVLLTVLRAPASPVNSIPVLSAGGPRSTAGRRQWRARTTAVAMQMAAAVALLTGAGALVRGYVRLMQISPGFEVEGLIAMQVHPQAPRYREPAALLAYYEELLERVRTLPGAQYAALTDAAPLTGGGTNWTYVVEGVPTRAGEEPAGVVYVVDPHVPDALGVPLVAGRRLRAADASPSSEGVLISVTLAERHFGTGAAVGRRLALGGVESGNAWMTVVGVVADIRDASLDAPPSAVIYRPIGPATVAAGMTLLLRSPRAAAAVADAAMALVREIDRDVAVSNVRTMQEQVRRVTARERLTAHLTGGLALIALLLAIVGVAGLFGQVAADQRRASAIRLVVGATPGDIVRASAWSAVRVWAPGALAGLVLALLSGRALAPFIDAAAVFDPLGAAASTTLLLGVAVLSAILPAVRVTRTALGAGLSGDT